MLPHPRFLRGLRAATTALALSWTALAAPAGAAKLIPSVPVTDLKTLLKFWPRYQEVLDRSYPDEVSFRVAMRDQLTSWGDPYMLDGVGCLVNCIRTDEALERVIDEAAALLRRYGRFGSVSLEQGAATGGTKAGGKTKSVALEAKSDDLFGMGYGQPSWGGRKATGVTGTTGTRVHPKQLVRKGW